MIYKSVKEGVFLSRPNRFIANVEIDGAVQVCHVKNTGRCKELLIPGARVFLEESANPNRKTKYDLVAVYKEDKLYTILNEITTPGVEYISALIIKANEVFIFYGDGVQITDANAEFERLKQEQAEYTLEKTRKKISVKEKITLPNISKLHLPVKLTTNKSIEATELEE